MPLPIEDLSTEEGIKEAFQKLEDKEKETNKLLDSFLSRQVHLEAKLKDITKALPELQLVHKDADHLVQMIHHTASLAEKVSDKVKKLDTIRSRVSECQQRVHDLIDLQLCCDGAEEALKNEDYEKACAHVHRFRSIDKNVLKQTANDVVEDCAKVDKSCLVLQEIAEKLEKEVSKKFDEAVKDEDLASVERFFKLYPLLDMHHEGLQKYSIYLAVKLSETSKKNLEVAKERYKLDRKANVIFADTITLLLEGTARVIETHQPLVETYYGPGLLLTLIKYLQLECDKQVEVTIDVFYRARELQKKNELIKEYNRQHKNIEKLDPKTIDVLINELTLVHSKAELYFRFIRRHVLNDVGSAQKQEIEKKSEELITNSLLYKKMQIILSDYLLLESYYMQECIQKAIMLNTLGEGALTSSMVDDVFFIIRKCVRRSTTSSSIDGICAIINYACSFLEENFCVIIRKQLAKGYPSGYMDLSQAYNALQSSFQQGRIQASDAEQSRQMFLTSLNNADQSLEFIEILRSGLNDEINKSFPRMTEKDKGKIENGLSGFGSVRYNLDSIKEYGMKQLMIAVEPRIKTWVDDFLNFDHELTEDEVSSYESSENFTEKLIININLFLDSFKPLLTSSNFELLVNFLTSEITKNLEKIIFETKFNRYGGLIFDKEIRALVSYLTSITSWSIRDKFARLIQMATLLNLERVAEIAEWEKSGVVWQLSIKEVKNILRLRRDFMVDEIKSVKI